MVGKELQHELVKSEKENNDINVMRVMLFFLLRGYPG
jgi:hypothetical protein